MTLTPLTAGSSSSRKRSYTLRCTRIRLRAQQSCPALSNTAYGAVAAAFSRSASANTMLALLPPELQGHPHDLVGRAAHDLLADLRSSR